MKKKIWMTPQLGELSFSKGKLLTIALTLVVVVFGWSSLLPNSWANFTDRYFCKKTTTNIWLQISHESSHSSSSLGQGKRGTQKDFFKSPKNDFNDLTSPDKMHFSNDDDDNGPKLVLTTNFCLFLAPFITNDVNAVRSLDEIFAQICRIRRRGSIIFFRRHKKSHFSGKNIAAVALQTENNCNDPDSTNFQSLFFFFEPFLVPIF